MRELEMQFTAELFAFSLNYIKINYIRRIEV